MSRRLWSEDEERNPPPGYKEKRAALLKVAAKLYAEHGSAAISIDRLSVQTGHAHNYHRRYFPTKESMVYGVLTTHLSDLLEALGEAEEAVEPRARLDALAACYLRYALGEGANGHRALPLVVHWVSAEHRLDLKVKQRWLKALFEEALTAAVPALGQAPQLVAPLAMSLFAMLNGAMHWLRLAPEPDDPRPWRHAAGATPRPLGVAEYARLAVACVVAGAGDVVPPAVGIASGSVAGLRG